MTKHSPILSLKIPSKTEESTPLNPPKEEEKKASVDTDTDESYLSEIKTPVDPRDYAILEMNFSANNKIFDCCFWPNMTSDDKTSAKSNCLIL